MLVPRTIIVSLTAGAVVALVLLGNGGNAPADAWGAPPASPTATATPPSNEPGSAMEVLNAASGAFTQLVEQGLGGISPVPGGAGEAQTSSLVAGAAGGVDAVVNDPSMDPGTTQNETTLAVQGSTICAGYNDLSTGGLSGLSRSPDLGLTWNDTGGIGGSGDPVLAVHEASGTFYYAQIAVIDGDRAIGVARSTDDCQSFPTLAEASLTLPNPSDLQDKPWMAVDNSGGSRDGDVYVCWTRFTDDIGDIDLRFSRSVDGGVTFIDEQVLSPPTHIFPLGCFVEVSPSGDVYVSWSSATAGGVTIWFLRSLDGGLNWLGPAEVNSGLVRVPGADRIRVCEAGSIRPTLNGDIRMVHQTWMAADTTGGPFDGRIYMVWGHDPPGSLIDNSDVFFSSSADGGLTWAPQLQIAGGTETDQFEPFVEVGGQGTVSIVWYDRRNDPANNWDIDVYTTFSTDGGASLAPISQLNDVSFPPIAPDCYMGEYIAIAADADNFYYAWGDNRNGNPDVFFDSVAVPPLDSVGGIAALEPELARRSLEQGHSSAASRNLAIIVALLFAAAFTALGAATWHMRTR